MRSPIIREHIKQTIQRWIKERQMQPGDRLLGQNGLAAHFRTTSVTIVRALNELAEEGILHRVNGKGTFIGASSAARMPEICLVLPNAHLEDPRYNPDFWGHVQTMHQAFVEVAGASRLFCMRVVPRNIDPAAVIDSFAHYEAVFFHYSDRPTDFMLSLILHRKVPVVVFGEAEPALHCLTIDHDCQSEARLAVRYLLELGYRRIAYVGCSESWCASRTCGYRKALNEAGIRYNAKRVATAPVLCRTEGERAATVLLERGIPFDAVFCASDVFAHGVLSVFEHSGIRVPADVGVMGFDGIRALTQNTPYLTTLAIPYPDEIRRALDVIAQLKPCRHTPRQHFNLTGQIIEGATTRAKNRHQLLLTG